MTALNLNEQEIEQAGKLLTEFLRNLEKSARSRMVVPALDRSILTEILETPFAETGVGIDELFRNIAEKIVPHSTATAHPRFLAYVLSPPHGIAPFAEAISAALNQNCNFWQLSPAASVIERKVVAWLAGLFGYPSAAGGILTSGGSVATLMALAVATHHKYPGDFRNAGLQSVSSPLVVYTSAEAHGCVEKAAAILGLGLDHVRKIPVDGEFRLRLDLLQGAVREDRRAGKTPFCVVATAGTINTGAVDPIPAIADLCAAENLWLHVDGAYGALFVLSESLRDELSACGLADSIALDPHKLLFAPLEAGCLLVRDRQKLRHAFDFPSSYLSVEEDALLTNYLYYGPELSRNCKAFKIWCGLKLFGVAAFRAAIDRMLGLATYMGHRLQADDRWELMAPVTLNAVCFRFRAADNLANQQILAELVAKGSALLGPVRIAGQFGIRACITNYRTNEQDIDLILDELLRCRMLAGSCPARVRSQRNPV